MTSHADGQTPDSAEKEQNAEIVKRITAAFLDFRKSLTMIVNPELGVVDDIAMTWLARYERGGIDPYKKTGRMHITMHTKTAPEPGTGKQTFNSFTIDSNVSFERDTHPALEPPKEVEEEEEKKKKSDNEEKIQEIISAAAARDMRE